MSAAKLAAAAAETAAVVADAVSPAAKLRADLHEYIMVRRDMDCF